MGNVGEIGYGREIGVVYCNGVNVNSELIEKQYARIYTDYCDVSEFANDKWAGARPRIPSLILEPLLNEALRILRLITVIVIPLIRMFVFLPVLRI